MNIRITAPTFARSISASVLSAALGAALLLALPTAGMAMVNTLSTGVGVDARVDHPEYSVRLSFAKASGPYLANIAVTVKDAQGRTVLDTVSNGPWLFIDLPAGDYHVVARDITGTMTGADFSAPSSGQNWVHLTWAS